MKKIHTTTNTLVEEMMKAMKRPPSYPTVESLSSLPVAEGLVSVPICGEPIRYGDEPSVESPS